MIQSDSLKRIRDLFKSQKLAVLSTFYKDQPYCNLVAFVETNDSKSLIFATNRNTRKYRNLLINRGVSLLIDDRTNLSDDFRQEVAITVLGSAEEATPDEAPYFAERLISKLPDIAGFVSGVDTAIFKVRINDYIIASFESVERVHIGDT
jgi:heme iron utilization protein